MQNFRLSPTGDNNQISLGETGNPTANEASAFSMQETASRRANIPQKKRPKAIKKQSVPYPFPYASGGQPMVPFYGAMNHPFQHLAAVCEDNIASVPSLLLDFSRRHFRSRAKFLSAELQIFNRFHLCQISQTDITFRFHSD